MHARIQNFPRLAAAVAACRDTLQQVVLVDAGDRWTGNAYVDKAPTPGMPVIALMNRLGYDVATLGNHEFDFGQAFLGRMIDSMAFEVVCANLRSDTCTFPQLPPYVVIERQGIRIGFVGVVTNYEGPGHPAGNAAQFRGARIPRPAADGPSICRSGAPEGRRAGARLTHGRRPRCGAPRTGDPLRRGDRRTYHELRDTLVNGTLLTQTGKNLANVGVTTLRLRGKRVECVRLPDRSARRPMRPIRPARPRWTVTMPIRN